MTFNENDVNREQDGKFGTKTGAAPEASLTSDPWATYRDAASEAARMETQALANTVRAEFPDAHRAYFEVMGEGDSGGDYLAVSSIEDAEGNELWESGSGEQEFLDALNEHAMSLTEDDLEVAGPAHDDAGNFLTLPPSAPLDSDAHSASWTARNDARVAALQSNKEGLAQTVWGQYPSASRVYLSKDYEGANWRVASVTDDDGKELWTLGDGDETAFEDEARADIIDFETWELDGNNEDYILLPVSLADERTWPTKTPF